jgi:hypothetical protein
VVAHRPRLRSVTLFIFKMLCSDSILLYCRHRLLLSLLRLLHRRLRQLRSSASCLCLLPPSRPASQIPPRRFPSRPKIILTYLTTITHARTLSHTHIRPRCKRSSLPRCCAFACLLVLILFYYLAYVPHPPLNAFLSLLCLCLFIFCRLFVFLCRAFPAVPLILSYLLVFLFSL